MGRFDTKGKDEPDDSLTPTFCCEGDECLRTLEHLVHVRPPPSHPPCENLLVVCRFVFCFIPRWQLDPFPHFILFVTLPKD